MGRGDIKNFRSKISTEHTHFWYYLSPVGPVNFGQEAPGAQLYASGRVTMVPIVVPRKVTISGIICVHSSVAAGNLRMGLYGPDSKATPLPDNLPLIAQTPSLACNGTTRGQLGLFGNVTLNPGLYWPALQPDNATDNYWRMGYATQENAGDLFDQGRFYNQTYGAFTHPCPVTAAYATPAQLHLRVVSVP